MIYIFKVDISIDTPTYIDAWSTLQDGHLDKLRTPVYPFFLGLMNIIVGDNYLFYVIAVQHIVFLASIRYFFCLLQSVVVNKIISYFITFFYALYPCVATYNCCVATETFAVVGMIFLLYSMLKLYSTKSCWYGLSTFFLLLFLVFLRPAVLYLLPITIIGWLIVAIKEKDYLNISVLCGWAGSLFVSILLVAYMAMFKYCYGVFTPSCVSLNNKYAIAKAANVIDWGAIGDDELSFCLVDENCVNAIGLETDNLINKLGLETFSGLVNRSISQGKGKYIKRLFQNVRNASEDNLFEPSYQIGFVGAFSDMFGIKIKYLYPLFLLYAIVLFQLFRRDDHSVFFSSMLFLMGVGNFVIIVIASPGEYGRLSLPAMPVYLIMFGQLLNLLGLKKLSEVNFL